MSTNGQPPFNVSDVDPNQFGSGGANIAPNQGVPAVGPILANLLERIWHQVPSTATLTATLAKDRVDGMLIVTKDTYTLWTWQAASTATADATHIAPTDVGAGAGRWVAISGVLSPGGTLQSGTGVLVTGTSAAIPATITASSRIVVTRSALNASTALGDLTTGSRVNGAPGSFVVTAQKTDASGVQTGDLSSFNWLILG